MEIMDQTKNRSTRAGPRQCCASQWGSGMPQKAHSAQIKTPALFLSANLVPEGRDTIAPA